MKTVIGPVGGRSFRVIWMLEELGEDFEHENVRPRSSEMFAANPLGQAPALRDGDTILTDSLAILQYMADRSGQFTFPPGTTERAFMEARINFVLTEMEAPLWLMARHGFVLPDIERSPGMRAVAEADFVRAEKKFEMLLGDEAFFGGPQFTIADIVAGHVASWAESAKIGLQTNALKDYLSRMRARPAWIKAEARREAT